MHKLLNSRTAAVTSEVISFAWRGNNTGINSELAWVAPADRRLESMGQAMATYASLPVVKGCDPGADSRAGMARAAPSTPPANELNSPAGSKLIPGETRS